MKISKGKASSKKAAPAKAVKKNVKKAAPEKATPSKAIKKTAPVVKKTPAKTIRVASLGRKKPKDDLDDDLKEFMHDDDDLQPIKKSRKDDLSDDDDFKMEDESNYWETRSVEKLNNKMDKINTFIETFDELIKEKKINSPSDFLKFIKMLGQYIKDQNKDI